MKKIILIGATGYLGGAIGDKLVSVGHEVVGLARSAAAEEVLRARGLSFIRGDIDSLATDASAISQADGVIFCAGSGDWARDKLAVARLTQGLPSSSFFMFTSGTSVLADDSRGEPSERVFAEDDPFTPLPAMKERVAIEELVKSVGRSICRAMVVRPPLVYGAGGSNQVPLVLDSARRTGAARFVGRGLTRYSTVHLDDLTDLFSILVDRGEAGALYHCVSSEIDMRTLASIAARAFSPAMRTESWTLEQALATLGNEHLVRHGLASNSRTISPRARALGWIPRGPSLEEDVVNGSYRQIATAASP